MTFHPPPPPLPPILRDADEIIRYLGAAVTLRDLHARDYDLSDDELEQPYQTTPDLIGYLQSKWSRELSLGSVLAMKAIAGESSTCSACAGVGSIPQWVSVYRRLPDPWMSPFRAGTMWIAGAWSPNPCPSDGCRLPFAEAPGGGRCVLCDGAGVVPLWVVTVIRSNNPDLLKRWPFEGWDWYPEPCPSCAGWGAVQERSSVSSASSAIEYGDDNVLLTANPSCVREGRNWRIAFGNKVYSSDSIGIRRIVILLQHKKRDVSTLMLFACGCLPIDKRAKEVKGLDLGEHDSGAADDSDDLLNENKDELRSARDVYLLGQAEAKRELSIARDAKEIARLEKVLAVTTKRIREYDAALRDRHSPSSHRTKAHRAIAKSIEREMLVMQEKHVELMAHLDSKAIKLGTKWCCYSPRVDVEWSIRE